VPETDEDWLALHNSATNLAAATNLLLIPGLPIAPAGADQQAPAGELGPKAIEQLRHANPEAWSAHALRLHNVAIQALKAIDERNVDALSEAGGEIDAACEGCHLQFWYPEG